MDEPDTEEDVRNDRGETSMHSACLGLWVASAPTIQMKTVRSARADTASYKTVEEWTRSRSFD